MAEVVEKEEKGVLTDVEQGDERPATQMEESNNLPSDQLTPPVQNDHQLNEANNSNTLAQEDKDRGKTSEATEEYSESTKKDTTLSEACQLTETNERNESVPLNKQLAQTDESNPNSPPAEEHVADVPLDSQISYETGEDTEDPGSVLKEEKVTTKELQTPEEEAMEEETSKEEDNKSIDRAATSPVRRVKGPRALSYSSIIRTRRTKTQEDGNKVSDESKIKVELKSELPETSTAAVVKSEESEEKSDNECEAKSKMGGAKGRGSRIRRLPKTLPENLPKLAAAEADDGTVPSGRGGRSKTSPATPQSHLTRATAASMKAVQFLQLPRQQKKRRRGGKSEDESDEADSKKSRVGEENEEDLEEEESGQEEEEELASKASKVNKPGRGRGRGRSRRGRGGGARGDAQTETPSEEEETGKKRKHRDSETDNDESQKDSSRKRRGRPKRSKDETTSNTSDTPSVASPIKSEEMDPLDQVEPVRNADQIVQLLQLSEEIDTGNLTDTIPSAPNVKLENDTDNTSTELPPATTAGEIKAETKDNSEKEMPPQVATEQPLTSSIDTMPTSSQAPPNAVPLEYSYPPRYSMEDAQGYPPFPPPIHPHSCLAIGYPPFSASPYHTFMLPTSPHFPYTTPQDCLPPPHGPLYFPSSDPFRYPPQTVPPATAATSTITQSIDSNKPPSSSMEQQSVAPPNPAHPTTPTISSPIPQTIGLSLSYPPAPHPGYMPPYPPAAMINPNMPPLIGDWNMTHQISAPGAPPPTRPAVPPPLKPKDSRFPLNLLSTEETSSSSVGNPVDCPECGRHFKNNKALNGHMRLHGGFDWTRRVCRPYVVAGPKKDENVDSSAATEGGGALEQVTNQSKTDKQAKKPSNAKQLPKLEKESAKENNGRHIPTLDDLCRAAEELERIERDGLNSSNKSRPTPLVLPHERRINSFSPPYTPPPILSPARSLVLLSGNTNATGSGSTPSKIWPQRKGSESKGGTREADDTFEPKINIGKEFQAEIPSCNKEGLTDHKAILVWKPLENLSQEDEDTIDGYLELACSPAIPHSGRNKELALHLLKEVNGSVKEAVKLLVIGKSLMTPGHQMSTYNYTGSQRWSGRERQQFRRAWRVHRKQFNMIQSTVETKTLTEIIEYYYSWKKYCPDEYRGRNRHSSEEVLSEEDEMIGRPLSAASNSSGSDHGHSHDSTHFNGTSSKSSISSNKSRSSGEKLNSGQKLKSTPEVREIPCNYGNHSLNLGPAPIQEYRCKYPGCNQVYTSIFALNGHIRIHGGSWYPKKPDVENMHVARDNSPPSSSDNSMREEDKKDEELRKNLEIAKTMVMDLPQPRSPAYSLGGALTPSPKASPNRGKSSLVKSKKACSASPADREGHYPCNRCGRVFPKVKSRSAHMKSHIIKQIH